MYIRIRNARETDDADLTYNLKIEIRTQSNVDRPKNKNNAFRDRFPYKTDENN